MKITGDQKIPVAFKFMDEKKTSKLQKDGSETRFVANFATEDDAIKFYKVLRQSPEYADLASDRSLDYHGLRIDNLVEYASGYREQREPIRRIVENAVLNDEGNYEYFKDDRKIILTPEIYENCKSQYQDANEKLNISRQKWQESINKEDNS